MSRVLTFVLNQQFSLELLTFEPFIVSIVTNKMASGSNTSRYDTLQARYDLLTTKAASGESILPNTTYADFLKYVYNLLLFVRIKISLIHYTLSSSPHTRTYTPSPSTHTGHVTISRCLT